MWTRRVGTPAPARRVVPATRARQHATPCQSRAVPELHPAAPPTLARYGESGARRTVATSARRGDGGARSRRCRRGCRAGQGRRPPPRRRRTRDRRTRQLRPGTQPRAAWPDLAGYAWPATRSRRRTTGRRGPSGRARAGQEPQEAVGGAPSRSAASAASVRGRRAARTPGWTPETSGTPPGHERDAREAPGMAARPHGSGAPCERGGNAARSGGVDQLRPSHGAPSHTRTLPERRDVAKPAES